jgi:hypothetical protein
MQFRDKGEVARIEVAESEVSSRWSVGEATENKKAKKVKRKIWRVERECLSLQSLTETVGERVERVSGLEAAGS